MLHAARCPLPVARCATTPADGQVAFFVLHYACVCVNAHGLTADGRANSSMLAPCGPDFTICYIVNSHTRGTIWTFSVEGLQSCGP